MKAFFSYYKPYKGLFFLDFGSAIVVGLLELIFPLITSIYIDRLLPTNQWNLIVIFGIALLFVFGIVAVLKFIVTYWGHKLGTNIERDMRNDLYSHIQKLNFKYFDNQKSGKLIGRLTNDLMDIGEAAHHGPEDVFLSIMTLIGAFVIMLTIDVKLALITFCVVPIVFILAIFFSQKMSRAFKNLFTNVSRFNELIADNVGGIRLVQAFTNEKHEQTKFRNINDNFRATKLKAYNYMSWNITISHIAQNLTLIIVLVVGSYFVLNGDLSYGGIVAFIMITNVLFKPLQQINMIIELFPKAIAGFKNFSEILSITPEIQDAPDAIQMPSDPKTIQYKDVTFGYGETPILKKLNLDIQHGEKIALVGPSGSGKTTISSLLPRFYEVDDGDILINGQSIKSIQLASLRAEIGVVQQDVFLFSGTLRDNIVYGHLEANETAIWDAVRNAQLETFIEDLPFGLDTLVGERGTKLSGGQKQRISIARMFLKDPSIIILDEATSALDIETENKIQLAFKKLSENRTSLIIAHRLSTIKDVDRIIFIKDGEILEEGSHEVLMQQNGHYKQLYLSQFNEVETF
ncbi:ABC transporter ATP-binding protein [Staphylococcus equorum]|uniref:ABC transporter ATP-binding protein n=2 Tax=Staphylococcus TaxID=1279 RepID=UPI0009BE296C|nr:ABC transporter ATP-binding protein [Staphylococcus equorum]MDK9847577.1 ABC transporter ATP-binding protein [Staphylococcus equorum]MDK9850317.1 ABC transporter ATP-binding protein [Staphylococcus equorum]MDK9855737.1 ABC transporter ATP-binding protein [Staphylococcus equorum]MEB7847954.1 ABC transporter ATP-binding protein/permease [Staphylococcus equorum]